MGKASCDGSTIENDHTWVLLEEPRLYITQGKNGAEVVKVTHKCIVCGVNKVQDNE